MGGAVILFSALQLFLVTSLNLNQPNNLKTNLQLWEGEIFLVGRRQTKPFFMKERGR